MLSVLAHAAGAERLILHQALHIALTNSPDLKAYAWSIEGRKHDADTAAARYYPKIHIEERFMRTDNPTFGFMSKLNQERFSQEDFLINRLNNPDDISDFQTVLTIEQPLFNPGIHFGYKMARKELSAREAEFALKKEEVALNVVKLFLAVQTAREYVGAAEKKIEDAAEHKRLASLRFDAGSAVYSDSLRADVAYKKAEATLTNAKADLEVSRRALGLALGRTEPVDAAEDRLSLQVGDVHTYLETSVNRKDLEALRMRLENAKSGVRMEKSGFFPEIGFRGSYQFNDHGTPFSNEGESYMIMGFLNWSLFDASTYSKIKKAQAQKNMYEEHLSALKNRIHFSIHNAYIKVMERKQNRALAKAILDEAEEAVRLVRLRYENSLASIVDLLDVQVTMNNARAGQVDAESSYTGAIADLYFESGIILKTLYKEYRDNGGH